MSSPLFNNPHHDDNSCPSLHDADLWSLLQEIDVSVPVDDRNTSDWMDPIVFEQENSAMVQSSKEKGLVGDNPINHIVFEQENSPMEQSSKQKGLVGDNPNRKTSERNRRIKHLQAKKTVLQHSEEQGSTILKKQNHNAKERVRRMQLNASYLALCSLIPDARRSKKRWRSPRIIDRVLEYIPEMENEIEELTLKKNNLLSSIADKQTHDQNQHSDLQVPTVSVNEVRKDEVIVQICMQREPDNVLSNLMQNVEGEGMGIISASSLYVCDERVCYHLHIQINGRSEGDDYKAHLKHKVISWLC